MAQWCRTAEVTSRLGQVPQDNEGIRCQLCYGAGGRRGKTYCPPRTCATGEVNGDYSKPSSRQSPSRRHTRTMVSAKVGADQFQACNRAGGGNPRLLYPGGITGSLTVLLLSESAITATELMSRECELTVSFFFQSAS